MSTVLKKFKSDFHRDVPLRWWAELHELQWPNEPPTRGTNKQRAEKLIETFDLQKDIAPGLKKVKDHILRKLTLDLICASFPEGHPPPNELVSLLKRALGLPESHKVGGWLVTHGMRDYRAGGIDHEARQTAWQLNSDYYMKHCKPMPIKTLAALVEKNVVASQIPHLFASGARSQITISILDPRIRRTFRTRSGR